MSVYQNLQKVKTQKANPVSCFLTEGDIHWNPQAYARNLDTIKLWSGGKDGIEYAGVLVGGYETVDGKVMPVISDVVTLNVWNIANREHNLQIIVEDFERIKNAKTAVGLVHSHPNGTLLPSLADWALFSYLHALHEEDGLIFIIMGADGTPAIYNFPRDEPYSKSFTELFRREREAAEKRTRKGQAERPDRGG